MEFGVWPLPVKLPGEMVDYLLGSKAILPQSLPSALYTLSAQSFPKSSLSPRYLHSCTDSQTMGARTALTSREWRLD